MVRGMSLRVTKLCLRTEPKGRRVGLSLDVPEAVETGEGKLAKVWMLVFGRCLEAADFAVFEVR